MTDTGSSVPRRQLGRYLKQAREQAGITLEAAARDQEWSRATMYRIEGGYAAVRRADVVSMCTAYGVSAKMTEALIALAAETKARGWWHAHGDAIPAWLELYVGLEAVASRLRQYQPATIPGLLQTREYAETLLRSNPEMPDPEIDRLVAVRMERQKILRRKSPPPPKLDVVLEEAALRRRAPGMKLQLAHLHEQATNGTATIRVVPAAAPLNYALTGVTFVIMDFAPVGVRSPEPTTVYSESLTGALYLDKPPEVATYDRVWEALEDLSLTPSLSADLIAMIAKETSDD
ncbi:helix-turn-helix domain-containing protein [Micromonospora sp. NPDC004704]